MVPIVLLVQRGHRIIRTLTSNRWVGELRESRIQDKGTCNDFNRGVTPVLEDEITGYGPGEGRDK
jgi:hypothetical protein